MDIESCRRKYHRTKEGLLSFFLEWASPQVVSEQHEEVLVPSKTEKLLELSSRKEIIRCLKVFLRVECNGDETQCILLQYYCILPAILVDSTDSRTCSSHRSPLTDTFLISLIIDTIYISWRLADRFCCHIPDVFLYGFFSSSPQLAIKSCWFHIHFRALLHP